MAKEYMLAHLLGEPRQEYDEFKSWPAHITILPWFVCRDLVIVEDAIEAVCNAIEPVFVQTGHTLNLGRNHDKLVRHVVKTGDLQDLHLKTLDVVAQPVGEATIQRKVEYFGNAYNPHITKHGSIEEDQTVIIDHLSLVSAEEDERGSTRMKTVERNFSLGNYGETTA